MSILIREMINHKLTKNDINSFLSMIEKLGNNSLKMASCVGKIISVDDMKLGEKFSYEDLPDLVTYEVNINIIIILFHQFSKQNEIPNRIINQRLTNKNLFTNVIANRHMLKNDDFVNIFELNSINIIETKKLINIESYVDYNMRIFVSIYDENDEILIMEVFIFNELLFKIYNDDTNERFYIFDLNGKKALMVIRSNPENVNKVYEILTDHFTFTPIDIFLLN